MAFSKITRIILYVVAGISLVVVAFFYVSPKSLDYDALELKVEEALNPVDLTPLATMPVIDTSLTDSVEIAENLAAVEQADTERAVHELELAVEQLPQSLGARALLSRAYKEAGQLGKALATKQTLKELKPRTPVDYLYGAWAVWMENL